MLIAGTPGTGKSVFLVQGLFGLLESTQNIQLYLLDLKWGVEMNTFKTLPNVYVAKNIDESVVVLRKIKRIIESRFKFLEKSGQNQIIPNIHKMDRIVIAVDEASVLYGRTIAGSEDADLVKEARILTDYIAKLSRAAGVHLILATQYVIKSSIDTSIQENLTGRMCFRTNSLENSRAVLGKKLARDLPKIPGRGIWYLNGKYTEVQVPKLTEEFTKKKIESLKSDFKNKKKFLFEEMIQADKSLVNESEGTLG